MDFTRMLDDLRSERQQIDEAIVVIERLAAGNGGKRRGRPPAWLKNARTLNGAKPKREPKE